MKRKIRVGILLMGGGIFLSSKAFAQASPVVVETGSINPGFFVAILAGVLMALGFQMVLTNLSVAAGVSAVGNIRKKMSRDNKSKSNEAVEDESRKENVKNKKHKDPEERTPLSVKILSGAGIWALITGVISLFFASFFAVKLSLIDHNGVGVALGLAIWAVFSFTMFYLESRGIGSLINGVFTTAIGAVKAAVSGAGTIVSGTGSLFRKSDEAKIESVATNTVDRLGQELKSALGELDIKNNLNEILTRFAPRPIDFTQLKDEFMAMLNDVRILQRNGNLPGEREIILSLAHNDPNLSKQDVSTLDKLIDFGKSTLKVAGALAGAGGIAAAVNTYFEKGKNINVDKVKHDAEIYILKKNEPEVEQDIVRAELDEIFTNESLERIRKHEIDKEYVAAIVAERKGVSRDKALKAADSVEEALNNILRESNIMEMATSKISSVKEDILNSIESRVRAFLDKINRPELDYDLLKSEFEFIMNNPKETPEVLRRKWKQFDRNTLAAILSANTKYSINDIDTITHRFEEVRNNTMNKLESTESGFKNKLHDAKDFALIQAENTRKTTAAASWWLFATFVLTGVAAAIGGMAAL